MRIGFWVQNSTYKTMIGKKLISAPRHFVTEVQSNNITVALEGSIDIQKISGYPKAFRVIHTD